MSTEMEKKVVPAFTRRRFIAGATLSIAGVLIGLPPASAERSSSIYSLMRLHPVRFVAGLVFDTFRSVVVEFATDAIVALLRSGQTPTGVALSNARDLEGDANFKHPNYKASAVILGVAGYRAHRERELKLLLKDGFQLNRFINLIDYLRDEGIRIKISKREYSYPVGMDTEPDDLFTLDYFQITSNKERHYANLIGITGTTAFKDWTL